MRLTFGNQLLNLFVPVAVHQVLIYKDEINDVLKEFDLCK